MIARSFWAWLVFPVTAFYGLGCQAETIDPSADKIVYVAYEENAVVSVRVKPGVLTRVVLHPDEKIETAASGVAADCGTPQHLWCIRADEGTSVVWIRPRVGAIRNNIEIRTNVRDYSLELGVVQDSLVRNRRGKIIGRKPGAIHYRLIFQYPTSIAQSRETTVSEVAAAPVEGPAKPVPVNWDYEFAPMGESSNIVPELMFDDGRFTYLRFAPDRELPVVFAVNPDSQEQRLNMQMEGGLVVLHQTQSAFVIRLGKATVKVRNNGFEKPLALPGTLEGAKQRGHQNDGR